MTDQKLSQLTASGALTGSELAYVVQSGNSRRTTTGAIAALAAATNLTYDAAMRVLSSSTGEDVTLPLAGAEAGLISAADQAKLTSIVVDRARLAVADVRNNSGVVIPKGAPVIVTGSSGTTKTVALADASLEATAANTLGLAADTIANNSDGLVITEGPLTGLNTAGLTEGQLIWLSETTGAITSTRPTQPAHGVVLGWCVKTGAGSAGILYVKVDNGLELNELHDVLITSPATGQVLRRAADGLWKNAALAAGDVSGLAAVATSGAYGDLSGRPSLGTAAAGTIGTAAGNVVALDGSARLPAVDGSQLTNLSAPSVADGTITDAKIAAAGLSQSSLNGSAITQWAPSTGYDKGALVNLQGIVYRRKTAGTTGATFDPTMWDQQTPTELSNRSYYTVGKYFNPSISSGVASGQPIAGSIIVYFPFEVRRRVRINGCRVRVATAVAATTFQIAIYAASAANVPTGLPLVNTGDMSMAANTAVDSSLTPTWLEPGVIYFRAVNVSGGTTGVFSSIAAASFEFSNLIGAASPLALTTLATSEYSLAWTYGTWPDMTSRTVTESTTVRCPVVPFLVLELG